MTITLPTPTLTTPAPAAGLHRFGCLLNSEWIKLRSLRSAPWLAAIVLLVSVGFAALFALAAPIPPTTATLAQQLSIVTVASSIGIFFAQLIVAVFGALVITGEYATGMIRSTLVAAPRRLHTLFAKALVLAVTTFALGAVSAAGSHVVVSAIFASRDFSPEQSGGAILFDILMQGTYLAAVAVFALGIGTVLRSSAGAITAVLGYLLIVPVLFEMIPLEALKNFAPYLLSNAGVIPLNEAMGAPGPLSIGQGLLIVLAWVIAALAAGSIALKQRDA